MDVCNVCVLMGRIAGRSLGYDAIMASVEMDDWSCGWECSNGIVPNAYNLFLVHNFCGGFFAGTLSPEAYCSMY